MSMMYCEKHHRQWDSDFMSECPECEHEPQGQTSFMESGTLEEHQEVSGIVHAVEGNANG